MVFANHSSHLDTPLIYGALPNRISKYLAAGAALDYFYDKWWKAGPMSLFFNGYPIDRSKGKETEGPKKRNVRGMSAALLDAGVPLLIYPEGSRPAPARWARSGRAWRRCASPGRCLPSRSR